MPDKQFKSDILWDKTHKFGKLKQMTDKQGKMWLMGDFNRSFKITIRENFNKFSNQSEWVMQLVPVKFSVDNGGQQQGFQQPAPPQHSVPQSSQDFSPQEAADSLGDVPF